MIDMLYKPFKHWSDGHSVWIFSDPHFKDSDCKIMDKDWISPETQIDIINKTISKHDTLILLGDIGDPSYLSKIKPCHLVLICGNHDYGKIGTYRCYFDEVYEGPLMIAEKILLSHEPIPGLTWCMNIHGHDHSQIEGCCDEYHMNLAANVCNYTPVNLKELIRNGLVSKIDSLNRQTINRARDKKRYE